MKIHYIKQKKEGKNRDIDIKDMGDYREIKRQLVKKEERLNEVNNQTKKISWKYSRVH